ncbi:Glycosyltransferase involved in cell wall bisynthesis [Devosia crocina]|uniref:Glycosyltransferase involved in cell wall bisynthesis n=1 Tax=Devosia crocina TaxID=429728 RepID=A0A1I7MWC7_9HYPH|nr:glycosyltransferase [Devosia crocina]SFV26721.1 Glycosyltransferase involved in cell wall bisynthesis [Devosia crocina]
MTKILIDLQSCQNASRFRGLGRYAKNMAREIAALAPAGSVHILLNSAFPHTLLAIRQNLADLVPEENIHVVSMLDLADDMQPRHQWRKQASALLREAYIDMLGPDVVFCPSFIEGYGDSMTVSLHRLAKVPTIVAIHDLIPLVMRDQYLRSVPDYERFYLGRIEELKTADGLIAISKHAFGEATSLLDFDAGKIVNALEGAEPEFRVLDLTDTERSGLLRKYGLATRFVFYTGGADPRKNLDRLITAFAALSPRARENVQLVLAGSISESEAQSLRTRARDSGLDERSIKLLGFVSDDQLVELYNLCTLFVFPSLHEGFGLPCLEAMQCGAATIGSNCSSVPEVLGNPDAQFDPNSTADISRMMEELLTNEVARQNLIAKGKLQAQRFSWRASGQKALDFLVHMARPSESVDGWQAVREGLERSESRLLEALATLPAIAGHPSPSDLAEVAQAMALNRRAVESRRRPLGLGQTWRIEGPFDTSYSLALVNRELGKALDKTGTTVSLFASEGPGDYEPSSTFLRDTPDVAALHDRSKNEDHGALDVVTRNMYPPRVLDMTARLNGLNCYAWEETGFPFTFAESFNESLQFITVTSEHVKTLLIDAGVEVPISVVGNGVDHWNAVVADPNYRIETAGHTFLHVSSCFPRKGADVLLESYGKAFTKADDVILVIKTFANPHNTIADQLETLRKANPDYPRVTLLFDDLTYRQMKALYEQCDTLVAPSRAEGFGLPLAEAMLSGLQVITTGWSGQLDFCTPETAELIDFDFAQARTHQDGKPLSVWAEPRADHLAQLLQDAAARGVDKNQGDRARAVLEHFTWDRVAQRSVAAAAGVQLPHLIAEPRLGWMSTFRKRCGIATYSEHLLDVLGMPAVILANTQDDTAGDAEAGIARCWNEGKVDDLSAVAEAIEAQQLDMVVIQFNYGFYHLPSLNSLIHRLCDRGRKVIVTLHATVDPAHDQTKKLADLASGLRRCSRILVHSIGDLNRLKAMGLVANVGLFPHGVLVPGLAKKPISLAREPFRIASYGFFLPNKGLLELIEAVKLLKDQGFGIRLDLINAAFPADISHRLIDEARNRIRALGLLADIRLVTDFLTDSESLDHLSRADLVIFPYQETAESASGAVRYGLAAGKPVAVTPLPIFEDVAQSTFSLPGTTPADIASGIRQIAEDLRANSQSAQDTMARAQNWQDSHAYPVLGRRLAGMLRGLHRDGLGSTNPQ